MEALSRPAVLRENRAFQRFFAASTLSLAGAMMTPITLAFAVLSLDVGAAGLGIVLGCRAVTNIAFLLFGGALADRISRVRQIQFCNVASGMTAIAMAWALATHNATVAILAVLAAVDGAVAAFAEPATSAAIPSLVPASQLQQANALRSLVRNGATLAGPMAASLLVVTTGPAAALALDGLTSLGAAALMARIVLPSGAQEGKTAEGLLRDLRQGWREFWAWDWLWPTVLAFSVANAIHVGAWSVIGPAVASDTSTLGVGGWGATVSAEALGMLLASLILFRVSIARILPAGILGISLFSLSLITLGLLPVTVWLVSVAFIAGIGLELFATGWNVTLMENVPEQSMARVISYDMFGSFAAIPVGLFVYGIIGEVFSARGVLLVSGAVYAMAVLSLLAVPSIRTMQRRENLENPDPKRVALR